MSVSSPRACLLADDGSSVSGPVSAPSVTGSAVAAVVPLTAKPTPLAFFGAFGASDLVFGLGALVLRRAVVALLAGRLGLGRESGPREGERRGGGGQGDGLRVHSFSFLSLVLVSEVVGSGKSGSCSGRPDV